MGATILLVISGVVTCAMRRTLVSRKARKRRIAENAEMSGENYYNRQNAAAPVVASGFTGPRSAALNAETKEAIITTSPNSESGPMFATFRTTTHSSDDDQTPLNTQELRLIFLRQIVSMLHAATAIECPRVHLSTSQETIHMQVLTAQGLGCDLDLVILAYVLSIRTAVWGREEGRLPPVLPLVEEADTLLVEAMVGEVPTEAPEDLRPMVGAGPWAPCEEPLQV